MLWGTVGLKVFRNCCGLVVATPRDEDELLHKEDPPAIKCPFCIVESERCAPLNEERNQNLYSLNDRLDSWIRQLATVYLKMAPSASVPLEQLPGRFKVFG